MTTDKINHPPHYTAHPSGVECIQITEHFSFNIGNIIKYLWRADEKGAPLTDLQKAQWYLTREITRRINEANTASVATKSDSSPTEKIGNVLAYAQAGDARRQYEMGNACAHGDGMPQDIDYAIEWWRLAAEQGNSEAQKALDEYVPQISARLFDIRGLAASGDRSAQQYLSECYQHGWYGLLVSPEMSAMWRSRANEPRTEEEAARRIEKLEAEAKKWEQLADEWESAADAASNCDTPDKLRAFLNNL